MKSKSNVKISTNMGIDVRKGHPMESPGRVIMVTYTVSINRNVIGIQQFSGILRVNYFIP